METISQQEKQRKAIWCYNDKKRRPTIIVRPSLHKAKKSNPTILFAMHMFENACEK
jgi:hypothetical protein